MDNASKCPVSGKRKYPTEGAALATGKHQVATADAPLELRAYRCTWCHAWHLTKKSEKNRAVAHSPPHPRNSNLKTAGTRNFPARP